MKREEAVKLLTNKKVYVGKHSKEIQHFLTNVGINDVRNDNCEDSYRYPFIYIIKESFNYGQDLTYFNREDEFEEITPNEILNIKLDDFKPDDLVYNHNDRIIGKISSINENGRVYCDILCSINGKISMNSHAQYGSFIGEMSKLKLADKNQTKIYNRCMFFIDKTISKLIIDNENGIII